MKAKASCGGEALVERTCPCGRTFVCTAYGVRAGRKWCSGYCQDNHRPGATERRRDAVRRWMRERRQGRARA